MLRRRINRVISLRYILGKTISFVQAKLIIEVTYENNFQRIITLRWLDFKKGFIDKTINLFNKKLTKFYE